MLPVVGTPISLTTYSDATRCILDWSKSCESRYVCVANVHMLMEVQDSLDFGRVVRSADLVTPDGMPLVWMMRLKGHPEQQRVYGPTLMLHVLEAAQRESVAVGFFGSSPKVVQRLISEMYGRFPQLRVTYSFSPPFRETSSPEDAEIIRQINGSFTRILFVGLGCPKQEKWMARHQGRINAVMIGVGAAFDFHAGVRRQAPLWMQKIGMEWFYRLATEPGRLWQRYLYHNPRFLLLAAADLLGLLRK